MNKKSKTTKSFKRPISHIIIKKLVFISLSIILLIINITLNCSSLLAQDMPVCKTHDFLLDDFEYKTPFLWPTLWQTDLYTSNYPCYSVCCRNCYGDPIEIISDDERGEQVLEVYISNDRDYPTSSCLRPFSLSNSNLVDPETEEFIANPYLSFFLRLGQDQEPFRMLVKITTSEQKKIVLNYQVGEWTYNYGKNNPYPYGYLSCYSLEEFDEVIYFQIPESQNGTWQKITRDMEEDLKSIYPQDSITGINKVTLQGNQFLVDDIVFSAPPKECSLTLPPYLFPIGLLGNGGFNDRFVYADHQEIDLCLVDKAHPEYPKLANQDMLESDLEHEEDIIQFLNPSISGQPLGSTNFLLFRNLPVDPTDDLLPPYLMHLGEPIKYAPDATYIKDLEIALQKAGYSVWPTVGILQVTYGQIAEEFSVTFKVSYRGVYDEQIFLVSSVNYPITNFPPLLLYPLQDRYICVGESLNYQLIAYDPDLEDQNGLSYRAEFLGSASSLCPDAGNLVDPATGIFKDLSFLNIGEYEISITVEDPRGMNFRDDFILFIENRRYVCPGGKGNKTGRSWDNAYQSIQQAIDDAKAGTEIWVAEGTYKENIILKDEISLFGGFQGIEERVEERNLNLFITSIDGQRLGSVVTGSPGATIDGFVLTNGQTEYGGGIKCIAGDGMVIQNNRIYRNTGQIAGGGIFIESSSNVEIRRNTIRENNAGSGAGMACFDGLDITIVNNIIVKNESLNLGAGLSLTRSSSLFINNTLVENNAFEGGAGIYCCDHSSIDILNSILWANENCTQINDPVSAGINELFIDDNSSCVLNYSDVSEGELYSPWLSGIGNINGDPLFVEKEPGIYHLSLNSPCRDTGNPVHSDPDGSLCDIGAYGGEEADWSILVVPLNDKTIKVNESLCLNIKASIPDQALMLYYYDDTDLFDIDSTSGKICFAPNSAQKGEYNINFLVTDGADQSITLPFHLSIIRNQDADFPLFTPPPNFFWYMADALVDNYRFAGSLFSFSNSFTPYQYQYLPYQYLHFSHNTPSPSDIPLWLFSNKKNYTDYYDYLCSWHYLPTLYYYSFYPYSTSGN